MPQTGMVGNNSIIENTRASFQIVHILPDMCLGRGPFNTRECDSPARISAYRSSLRSQCGQKKRCSKSGRGAADRSQVANRSKRLRADRTARHDRRAALLCRQSRLGMPPMQAATQQLFPAEHGRQSPAGCRESCRAFGRAPEAPGRPLEQRPGTKAGPDPDRSRAVPTYFVGVTLAR